MLDDYRKQDMMCSKHSSDKQLGVIVPSPNPEHHEDSLVSLHQRQTWYMMWHHRLGAISGHSVGQYLVSQRISFPLDASNDPK